VALEKWEPLISPLYLQSCWLQLQQAWEAAGITAGCAESLVRHYLLTQQISHDESGMLGAYLQICLVPPMPILHNLLERVQRTIQDLHLGDSPELRGLASALLAGAVRGMPIETAHAIVDAAIVVG
jgi:hypothetical protein